MREAGISLPYDDQPLRGSLGRAIAFYLFDDVEVPSLVWNTSLNWMDDIVVADADSSSEESEVWVFRAWNNALWGDPLMEGALQNTGKALLEGYGSSPIVFGRQHTKRLWYSLYSALRLLLRVEQRHDQVRIGPWDAVTLRDILLQTAEALRTAPCF